MNKWSDFEDNNVQHKFAINLMFCFIFLAFLFYANVAFATDKSSFTNGEVFNAFFCKILNLTKNGPATFFATMVVFGIGWQAFQGKISIWVSAPAIIGIIFILKGAELAAFFTGTSLNCSS